MSIFWHRYLFNNISIDHKEIFALVVTHSAPHRVVRRQTIIQLISLYFLNRTTDLFSEANNFLRVSTSYRRHARQWQGALVSARVGCGVMWSFEVRTRKRSPGGSYVLLDLNTMCCVIVELCSWIIRIWNIKAIINIVKPRKKIA